MNESQYFWVQSSGSGDLSWDLDVDFLEILSILNSSSWSAHVDNDVGVGHNSLHHFEIVEVHISDNPGLTQVGTQFQFLHFVTVVEPIFSLNTILLYVG